MDIVVKGRNVEVPAHFREHVQDKLAPAERLDSRVIHIDVELTHEKNPRQADRCQRVEITCQSKGPVIRAEACDHSFYVALDAAVLKLEARLRKAHDRRRVHHGRHTPPSVSSVTSALPTAPLEVAVGRNGSGPEEATELVAVLERRLDGAATPASDDDTEMLIVRDKTHDAAPMSTAEALHEMELVGHDFFLFLDAETLRPSVVYRRHGYDYGVIRLAAA